MKVAKVKPELIQDEAFGHTIKATKVVRNFPFPETMSGLEGGKTELVLVNVRATAGKKYAVPLSDGDFRLSTEKDGTGGAVATTMAETAMTDAGTSRSERWARARAAAAGSPSRWRTPPTTRST